MVPHSPPKIALHFTLHRPPQQRSNNLVEEVPKLPQGRMPRGVGGVWTRGVFAKLTSPLRRMHTRWVRCGHFDTDFEVAILTRLKPNHWLFIFPIKTTLIFLSDDKTNKYPLWKNLTVPEILHRCLNKVKPSNTKYLMGIFSPRICSLHRYKNGWLDFLRSRFWDRVCCIVSCWRIVLEVNAYRKKGKKTKLDAARAPATS